MRRVIFYLAEADYVRLAGLARAQSNPPDRVSVAHLIREAIREWLEKAKNGGD